MKNNVNPTVAEATIHILEHFFGESISLNSTGAIIEIIVSDRFG